MRAAIDARHARQEIVDLRARGRGDAGSGLALGREGPSVQMGASVAHFVGKVFRREWPDCRVLLAAGAGAGLATAFNAPMAGAVFVLEELVRRLELRIAVAALGASATAIAVARVLLGDALSQRRSKAALLRAGSCGRSRGNRLKPRTT